MCIVFYKYNALRRSENVTLTTDVQSGDASPQSQADAKSDADPPPLATPLQSKSKAFGAALAAVAKEGIAQHVAEEKNDRTDEEPGSREDAPVQLPPVAASAAESTEQQPSTSDGAVAMEVAAVTPAGPRRYLAICDNHGSDEDEMDFEEGDVSAVKAIDFESVSWRFDDHFPHCCCRNWSVALFRTKTIGSKGARLFDVNCGGKNHASSIECVPCCD